MLRKEWEEEVVEGGGGGDVGWRGICRWMKESWRVGERKRDLERFVAWGKSVKSKRGML